MVYKWESWSEDKVFNVGSKIYNEINYGSILWTCGFVKTSLSSALFVIGFTLIFNGFTNHPVFSSWSESAIFFGALAIVLGFLIIYIIDKKRERMKKIEFGREQESIEKRIFESNKDIESLVHDIAEERIEKEIYKQLKDISNSDDFSEDYWLEDVYND